MVHRTICNFALALTSRNAYAREQLEHSPIAVNFNHSVEFQCGGYFDAFQKGVVRGIQRLHAQVRMIAIVCRGKEKLVHDY